MAIYHLHVKVLTRSKGHSAIKAAAYRSGTALKDIDGAMVDYSRRADVTRLPIVGENLPDWAKDRQSLWESVERVEKRKDAQLAREVEVALPIELSDNEKILVVERFSRYLSFMYGGVPVDAVIHNKQGNPHAHLLFPTRCLTPDGWGQKDRSKNNPEIVKAVRKEWAELSNEYLFKYQQRIDHRSYKERGIDKVPQVHLGKKFWIRIKEALAVGVDTFLKRFDEQKSFKNFVNTKLDKLSTGDIYKFLNGLKPPKEEEQIEQDEEEPKPLKPSFTSNGGKIEPKPLEDKKTEQDTTDLLQVPQQEPEKQQDKKRSRDRGRGLEL